MPANALQQARELGQSIWLDYIDRDLLESGQLARLVERGLGGLTSNPTIFEKAISEGTDYDEDLERFASGNREPAEVFEDIAIKDVGAAADVLRTVYDGTGGADGFVSIEVNPKLAYDAEATIAEARRLFGRLNRPNALIKVPATPQGIPAIRTLIGEGVNVNVTLIFSRDMYRQVANAYIDGLADLAASGAKPLSKSASVASFFVSRVDTSVDKRLPDDSPHRGKAGIANARLAYADFQEIFGARKFAELEESGARVQRPLWASTSVKNPDYPELMYVHGLMGPKTVNTLPPATLDAFFEQGGVEDRLSSHAVGAQKVMDDLAEAGVDMQEVTGELLEAGVDAFADSFEKLMARIAEKSQELLAASQG